MIDEAVIEDLLRHQAPQVVAALVRRYGRFDQCEDATQEALLAAAMQWPREGVPDNPRAWLMTVASRRLVDVWRSEHARRDREAMVAADHDAAGNDTVALQDAAEPQDDDTLALLFLCCHPALSPASQVALTLRAVGGLATAEIARAFLVPEPTMAQRISRAKQSIKASGIGFAMPSGPDRAQRLQAVLQVLYLIFNEGYTASSGADLHRSELTREAIRLTREVHRLLPADGEVAGLLALMLLTEARRPARQREDGALVALVDQDRARWDQDSIREGVALITATLRSAPVGPYQLQAAIAAVHAEAESADRTDWPQILALYELLERAAPGPMVTLNRAAVLAMVKGPAAGLELVQALERDSRVAGHHRLEAVRAHLLELAGERDRARSTYRLAARRTTSLPERRYLEARADALG